MSSRTSHSSTGGGQSGLGQNCATLCSNSPTSGRATVAATRYTYAGWWSFERSASASSRPLYVPHASSATHRSRAHSASQPLSFGCIILLSVVHEFHEFHDVSYTIFASFIILLLFSAGAIFVPSAAGWAHIAYRIHRSLRAADADGDDARIYIPPIALLVVGTRFTRRPPFYEPLPFIACENLRDLGARIRKVEHRLCVQECTADPLAELEWLA
jgi:hypothetical protein